MAASSAFLFSLALAILSPTAKDIERAFLQNSPEMLRGVLPAAGSVHMALPEPISFSDRLSPEQAALFFTKIFALNRTLEFFPEQQIFTMAGRRGGIFRARWSFRNARNGNQYAFRVFFLLLREDAPKTPGSSHAWRVAEIRAEKL